jgi:DNA polymerase-3 subunit delta
MPLLTTAALRKQLASGETDALFALVGADDAEKAAVAGEFADMVDEGLRAFNVERLYGGEIKVDRLIDSAMTLPMMAPRRVILVIEGEKLLMPKRESAATDEEQERLIAFIKAPPTGTTVVFVCGAAPDKRRRAVKALFDQAHIVDCGSIGDVADAEKWVKARAGREGGAALEPAAVKALVELAGLDIVRLRAGLERVLLYSLGQRSVTADDVRQVVPAGPQAQEDFGIANAVRDGDARGALSQLGAALDGGAVPFVLLGQLRWVAEKLPPPRIRAGIDAVFRTDVALKSSGGDHRTLLERLVVELCGTPRRGAPSGR